MSGQAIYRESTHGIGHTKALTRLPTSCPNAHQMESTVRRYWCEAGMNSGSRYEHMLWRRNITHQGTPPNPPGDSHRRQRTTVRQRRSAQRSSGNHRRLHAHEMGLVHVQVKKDVPVANMPMIRSVRLKDHLRPQTSEPTPQNAAPTRRPRFWPSLSHGPSKLNSMTTGERMRPVTICEWYKWSDIDPGMTNRPEIVADMGNVRMISSTTMMYAREPSEASDDE